MFGKGDGDGVCIRGMLGEPDTENFTSAVPLKPFPHLFFPSPLGIPTGVLFTEVIIIPVLRTLGAHLFGCLS